MQVVYIVKSFGPENGYLNLKAFANIEDEWVEIEDMMVDYG